MREFLKKKLPEKPGMIINTQGQQVGTHRGTAFYTIGQRHGLDLPFQAYVAGINTQDNIITVAPKDAPELEYSECTLTDRHRIGEQSAIPLKAQCKIRYRQALQSCTLTKTPTGMKLHFDQPQQFIAPGQFGVVYQDGRVLGSGVIV
jgi:tRNA-specific 2-thiouridylase